ncbi:alpha-glucosidase [Leptospira yanagawae]|uniref:Alpha-glucosidase n=1 Tax=Leptospira yanagawae TaxID=293069 RepID=A0ABY2M7S4_9LEPT|nr:alpha-glucosidase [Leptospira yanagawae]TGL23853.1 alpha-glucosidase [Leptospira yanagawae]
MVFRFLSLCSLFLFLECASHVLSPLPIPEETFSVTKQIQWIQTPNEFKLKNTSFDRNFIELSLNEPFLTVSEVETVSKYRMASFKFEESTKRTCSNQTVDSIKKEIGKIIILGKLTGKNCESNYQVTFSAKSDTEIEFKITVADETLNRIQLIYGSHPEEKFFGLGEQFTYDEFKGKKPFFFTEEQGIGRGDQPITAGANLLAGAGGNAYTTYAPIPHYITSENRSVFFENSGYAKFDFSDSKKTKIEFWDFQSEKSITGTLWLGSSAKSLIQTYTKKTGRFPKLPDWAYGTWLGVQGGSEKVTTIVKQAKDAGNPVTALWIQDWCGRRVTNFGDQLKWRWYADETLYPDFKKFVKSMNDQNVQVLGYINSFLADTDPKKPGDDFTNPLLTEAKSKGYLVKNGKGEDYLIQTVGFPAYLIDLTNPAAVKWTKDLIKKNLIGMGLSGWMADFGEWLPYDAKLHSGVDAKVYHNRYPVDWARINREAIKEAGMEGKIVFFTRAGYSYSNAYSTLFWEGDQMVSFGTNDGLPSSIVGLTTSGISGYALNHSDIGGYTTISNPLKNYHRTKELLLRWAETSAFTPVFRTHEGNRPLKNWQVYTYTKPDGTKSLGDEDTVQLFAKIARIHFALKPYIQSLVEEASLTGLPVVRHNAIVEPDDKTLLNYKYQFFLGDDLLVAPVVESNEIVKDVYLPRGKWTHFWTGTTYEGNHKIQVSAPIGKPPAFIRVGGKSEMLIRSSLESIRNKN